AEAREALLELLEEVHPRLGRQLLAAGDHADSVAGVDTLRRCRSQLELADGVIEGDGGRPRRSELQRLLAEADLGGPWRPDPIASALLEDERAVDEGDGRVVPIDDLYLHAQNLVRPVDRRVLVISASFSAERVSPASMQVFSASRSAASSSSLS